MRDARQPPLPVPPFAKSASDTEGRCQHQLEFVFAQEAGPVAPGPTAGPEEGVSLSVVCCDAALSGGCSPLDGRACRQVRVDELDRSCAFAHGGGDPFG
jgi:hypothetical protein